MADTPRIEDLKRRVQSDPASIAFAALAEEYRRAGRFEEAIAACTAGLARHPAYLSAHVTLGRALIEIGRFDDARTELEYVLNLAPENLAAIRGLAEIHQQRGEDLHAQYAAGDNARYGVGGTESAAAPPPAEKAGAPSVAAPMPPASPPGPVAESVDAGSGLGIRDAGSGTWDRGWGTGIPYAPAPVLTAAPRAAESTRTQPALAGLETFLNAIVRARAERAAAR